MAAAFELLCKLTLAGIPEADLCELQVSTSELSAESCKGEHPSFVLVLPGPRCAASFGADLALETAVLKKEGLRAEERDLAGLEPAAVSSPKALLSLRGCAKASR